ncbi:D-TA family PLP-dependent enzyme [Arundinibacter roseus]|uniref:D-TA family PLP-dependent enzyme n=1 Tax=Arundinibacter roseus TaxID=2070510 RepID=A0A4R4KFZ3_9BACT|nr:D-TA family PLP-dependent enzyme [Arundinibacter roseus]TDB66947.1 D-TA family PLP-dependent enzyme [Arundinibacter roseus]
MANNWFEFQHSEEIDSPSLVIYKDRILHNIELMIRIAGSPGRLVPHVKTHKMAEVVQMQLDAGIQRFKCATIAEAEMLAMTGAPWILIAYQLTGPNLLRLQKLKLAFPAVTFSSLIDSIDTARQLNELTMPEPYDVFIDINNGMNRSGHLTNDALFSLYQEIVSLPNLRLIGLHVYDGHIRDEDFMARKQASDLAFEPVTDFCELLRQQGFESPVIIAGGSPTFTVHAQRTGVLCSPGTCLLWDWGYGDRFLDQPFLHAAVLLTRVVSKPAPGIITVDLGHKAVAAENSIEKRFRFLNLNDYQVLSQSEEHGVIAVKNSDDLHIGDLLYAIPYHICPTVALHENVTVVEDLTPTEKWEIVARKRKITF